MSLTTLARKTMNKAEAAPTQIGSNSKAMTVLSHFGTGQVFGSFFDRAS